jgi:hypothetical protein
MEQSDNAMWEGWEKERKLVAEGFGSKVHGLPFILHRFEV